ncbi:hypothetical protein J2741_001817 [Methanolinea mesophila]|uniref:hypothetical protein n=1 Tax=Methanolinea mesophila TaxID=547055 RepID=UPI001AEB2223|nr:hypothetical protein [Methanolinea mesophila]MBP1929270.1 hypothetical protein [Methanolinea mesophila]
MMKDKLLLILALAAFSLVPLVQVVTADTLDQGAGAVADWNSYSMNQGSSLLSGTDWIFGPVTPSPTPANGSFWFPAGEKFNRTPLPKRPDMNYSAFYSLIKRDGSGFILPSPYPTPKVVPTWTRPTERPMPTWTIPTPRPMPTFSLPSSTGRLW